MFSSDEVISVPSGEVKTPDADLIDNVGGSRATRARMTNRNGVLWYRFNDDPDVANGLGHRLAADETVDLPPGYENIKNLRLTAEDTTCSVFISYGN
jgi:hypothetical protein